MKIKFHFQLILLFLLISVYLYHGAFGAYFFQDDWFSLSISKAKNIQEFLDFFIPRSDLIYYRPLGMQFPFFVFQKFFGLNPLPFRIATLAIHLLNGFLCYHLLLYFMKQRRLAVTGAILYISSIAHMTIFYWASTFAFVLAPAFYFSSVLAFTRANIKLSLLLFSVGLASNELLVTLPLTLTIYFLFARKEKDSRTLWGFWVILFLYITMRLHFGSAFGQGEYELTLHVKQILVNARDYILWAFNWPEEIRNQFSTLLKPNFSMAKSFPFLWINLGVITFMHVVLILYLLLKPGFRPRTHMWFLGMCWFGMTMIPVLFFSKHSFSYYLPIPLFGLIVTYLAVLERASTSKIKMPLLLGVTGMWLASAWISVQFNIDHHWTVKRAHLAGEMLEMMRRTYPPLPADSVVVVRDNGDNTNDQKWAWGDQHAMQEVYDSPNIITYFLYKNDENGPYTAFPGQSKEVLEGRIFRLPCRNPITCW